MDILSSCIIHHRKRRRRITLRQRHISQNLFEVRLQTVPEWQKAWEFNKKIFIIYRFPNISPKDENSLGWCPIRIITLEWVIRWRFVNKIDKVAIIDQEKDKEDNFPLGSNKYKQGYMVERRRRSLLIRLCLIL